MRDRASTDTISNMTPILLCMEFVDTYVYCGFHTTFIPSVQISLPFHNTCTVYMNIGFHTYTVIINYIMVNSQ